MTDFDTSYMKEAVCPYCGHAHPECWEWHPSGEGEFTHECDECNREFSVRRDVEVSYTTREMP
ncbi:MAG: hypothetical protein ACEQSH_00780 [Bacteroidia bacterium]